MRGPARKPTEHLILSGSDRGKARAKTQPKLGFCIPDPPPYLSEFALSYWPYVVSVVEPLRCTTEADAMQLGIMADALASMADCDVSIADKGRLIPSRNGAHYTNPAVDQRNKAIATIQSCLDRLGLNPACRSKVVELAPKLGEVTALPTQKKSRYSDDD